MSSRTAAPRLGAARGGTAWWCKNAADRIGALLLLIVTSPLWILVALLVWVTSGTPILYRRRVVGLHGVEIEALKFRTMVPDAEAMLDRLPELRRELAANMKLREDPRVTSAGRLLRRTSLDELPQLLNVLRGEMSLVGPRMISAEEVGRYREVLEMRLQFKPGMTGLWQISGRQRLPYEERIRLDAQYMENWSLWLDLKILLKTVPAVLSMRGAF